MRRTRLGLGCMGLAALILLTGCESRPKPFYEEREMGRRFFAEEWLLGTTDRTVPIEAELAREAAPSAPPTTPGIPLPGLHNEPHGFLVKVVKAKLYRRLEDGDLDLLKTFDRNIRFWLAPNGLQVATQDAWRDNKIRVYGISGRVRKVPIIALEGLPPTYGGGFPFAFVRWEPDSEHIIVASVHPPSVEGYAYIALWRLNMSSGRRDLYARRILLLSEEVSDWRLIKLTRDDTLKDVERKLLEIVADSDGWVRRAALRSLVTVRERIAKTR